jgi:hypothetical protein
MNLEVINKSKSQMLYRRISKALNNNNSKLRFSKEHESQCEYPIICGDMNNSAYLMFIEMQRKVERLFRRGRYFGLARHISLSTILLE